MPHLPLPEVDDLVRELIFTTSRSSKPGGQNVNKVNTKVLLKFDVVASKVLSDDQKELLFRKLASKLTKDGVLMLTSQEERSQLSNKEAAVLKFRQIVTKAFTPVRARKATKPGKAAKESRRNDKRHASQKKQMRQKPI